MADTQGKGPYSNEGRIEKSTSRPDEQGKTDSSYAPQRANESIQKIKEQTRNDIRKKL